MAEAWWFEENPNKALCESGRFQVFSFLPLTFFPSNSIISRYSDILKSSQTLGSTVEALIIAMSRVTEIHLQSIVPSGFLQWLKVLLLSGRTFLLGVVPQLFNYFKIIVFNARLTLPGGETFKVISFLKNIVSCYPFSNSFCFIFNNTGAVSLIF